MPPCRGFRELDVHVGNVAHIREHPDLGLSGLALDHRLELAVDRELHVPLVVGERRIRRHIPVRFAVRRGEALQIAGDELEAPASVVDGKRPRIPHRGVFRSRLRCAEVDRRERRTVGAVRQFVALRRRYRIDPLGPVRIVELREPAGAVEDEVVLQRHVADRNVLLRDEWAGCRPCARWRAGRRAHHRRAPQ